MEDVSNKSWNQTMEQNEVDLGSRKEEKTDSFGTERGNEQKEVVEALEMGELIH